MLAKPTILKCKRLQLRPLTNEDAPQIALLAGEWDIARMTDRIPYPYQEQDALKWIDGLPAEEQVFAIDLDGTLIGLCGLMERKSGEAEIGYWIGKPWWGAGYATEATSALLSYCFKHRKLSRLICCHYIDNPASARVIQKLGFEESGECSAWCQARRKNVLAITYELKRPRLAFLWRPARRRRAA